MKNNTITRRSFMAKGITAVAVGAAFLSNPSSFLSALAATGCKCYTIATGNTTVYKDAALREKYGTIYDSDELILESVSGDVCLVTYPTSKGTKTGYVKTSAVLLNTDLSTSPMTASKKITAYTRPSGAKYGSVFSGDQIYRLGTKGEYTQVKYPTGGSSYKIAFVKTAELGGNSGSSSGSKMSLSSALYQDSKARLTCGFDGYTSYSKKEARHEGIDFSLANGENVYALVDGTVINVIKGANGSDGLSQIAVYNSSLDRTILYLHTNPAVSVNDTIVRGQKIATQGWRGCSSSSGGHTHVEMRVGRRERAAKSLKDPNLDNPNPTSFWESQGYTVG